MPFQMQININPLSLNVTVGDQIFWTNNDTYPHWPGLENEDGSIDTTFFMPYQIAGASSSPTFSPGVAGTLKYVCSIHRTCGVAGKIVVTS